MFGSSVTEFIYLSSFSFHLSSYKTWFSALFIFKIPKKNPDITSAVEFFFPEADSNRLSTE